jgi:hypothetical protein
VERKTIAFLPSHPAQLWLMRPVEALVSEFAETVWVLRDKDCELALADAMGLEYVVLSRATNGLWKNGAVLLGDILRAARLTLGRGIDVWVTKYGAANIAARLLGRKSAAFNDDDADVVPLIAWASYPFANWVMAPTVTRMGRFSRKTLRFAGNYELFYLHPNRFVPDRGVLKELGIGPGESFAIIRLSALQAHHDIGVRGVSEQALREIIGLVDGSMRLFVSSEKPLSREFEPYRLPIAPDRIHHALAFAEFFLGDSQTMTSEAAVLGTPAFRLNDFVGRLSYLEELQDYGLSFGFRPGQEDRLLERLGSVLRMENRRAHFLSRRQQFLEDKIDPVPWFAEQIRRLSEGATLQEARAGVG